MSLFFKKTPGLTIFLLSALLLLSCDQSGKTETSDPAPQEKGASEEEIKYFFPMGWYNIRTGYLEDREEEDGYVHIDSEALESKNTHIVDAVGNIINRSNLMEFVKINSFYETHMFKKTKNLEGYKTFYEYYQHRGSFYCTKPQPEVLPEDLIFDDELVVGLYDKGNQAISTYQMRNEVNFEDYKRNPEAKRHKIKPGGESAYLIGMLELPPKKQREGLKYRVTRSGLNEEMKFHQPLTSFEKPLASYSEYKNWHYSKWSGCYIDVYHHGTIEF